jgi:hypothetical protein
MAGNGRLLMASERNPDYSVLLKKEGKTKSKIELFFPLEMGERYRVRVNGRWHQPGRDSHVSPREVDDLIAAELGEITRAPAPEPKPDIRKHTSVRVANGKTVGGERLYDVTRTSTDPFQGYDGRWYVGVIMLGEGVVMVPVEDVEVRR